MKTFTIKITEYCKCEIEVEAENATEAQEIAEKEYWKDPSGYCLEPYETEFEVIREK